MNMQNKAGGFVKQAGCAEIKAPLGQRPVTGSQFPHPRMRVFLRHGWMQLLMLLVRALPMMAQVVVVSCIPRKLRIVQTAHPNRRPILTNILPMIPWTMKLWVDLGPIPASILPMSNLAMKLWVGRRPTP
jgi:hypothetical protein